MYIDYTQVADGSWTMWVDGFRALVLGDPIMQKTGAVTKGEDWFV